MKALLFDSGPIISLTMNNLLWIIEPLKAAFRGQFLITPAVKKELIEVPLNIKRFEYEALQVMKLVDQGVLEVAEPDAQKKGNEILDLMNSIYQCKGNPLRIVHEAEVETLSAACALEQPTLVIDERTVRLLLEDPESLRKLMEKRLHAPVTMNRKTAADVNKMLCDLRIIRSAELVAVAYTHGLFQNIVPAKGKGILLDALLWGVKTNGCSITEREIEEIKKAVL